MSGGKQGRSNDRPRPLAEGENLIGRDPGSKVCLDYSTVSRRHALIVVGQESALLEDLGSKNGTSVGGVRLVGPATLRDGDRIGFGQVFVTYRESRAGMPTVTQVSRVGGASPIEPGEMVVVSLQDGRELELSFESWTSAGLTGTDETGILQKIEPEGIARVEVERYSPLRSIGLGIVVIGVVAAAAYDSSGVY